MILVSSFVNTQQVTAHCCLSASSTSSRENNLEKGNIMPKVKQNKGHETKECNRPKCGEVKKF